MFRYKFSVKKFFVFPKNFLIIRPICPNEYNRVTFAVAVFVAIVKTTSLSHHNRFCSFIVIVALGRFSLDSYEIFK